MHPDFDGEGSGDRYTGCAHLWLEQVGAAAAAANARSKGEEVPKGADPLQKLFDELDTNSNGSLDQAELVRVFAHLHVLAGVSHACR